MNVDYKSKDPIQIDLSKFGINNQHCIWNDIDHPMHRMPEYDKVFSYYWNDYHFGKWIRPGMTCIDIGAHIGDTAIPMMVASQGTVLAIEPNTYMLPFLEKNCEANRHLGNFVIATEAVTNQASDSLVFGDHNNSMINGGLLDTTWDSGTAATVKGMTGTTITVKGLPFNDICQKYLSADEINQIGFVKTDTEGHDIEIIRSMTDFLKEKKPVLFTEWFFGYSRNDSERLFDAIRSAGYVPYNPATMELADINNRCEDLVCIHQDNL